MKAAVVVLTLATAVFAQSPSSTSSAPVPSGMPTGTSTTCSAFLTRLNENREVNKCLTAIIGATESTPNSAAVTSALGTICASNFNDCAPGPIRQALTDFYANCGPELLGPSGLGTDGNKGVIQLYDFLYLITPMRGALCSKGDDGKYCVMRDRAPNASGSSSAAAQSSGAASDSAASSSGGSSSSASSSASTSATSTSSAPTTSATNAKRDATYASLMRRQASNTTQDTLTDNTANTEQYRNLGLPYLFITPDTTDICNTCTRKIIASYIDFETITPYAIGIPNSPLLSGQVKLWEKMKTCGSEFINSVLNGTAAEQTGGAPAARTMSLGGVVLAVMGAVAAVMI